MTRLIRIALAVAMLAPMPATACRVAIAPAGRIAIARSTGYFAGVLHVRIDAARLLAGSSRDGLAWRADATLEGQDAMEPMRKLTFERVYDGGSCNDRIELPKPGDRWVLYFEKSVEGALRISLSFPLATAEAADPVLKPILR